MIGRKVEKLLDDDIPDERVIRDDEIAVSLRNYRVDMPGEQVNGIDMDIRKGEIFGIGGWQARVNLASLTASWGFIRPAVK